MERGFHRDGSRDPFCRVFSRIGSDPLTGLRAKPYNDGPPRKGKSPRGGKESCPIAMGLTGRSRARPRSTTARTRPPNSDEELSVRPDSVQPSLPRRSGKWKDASTIVESRFHSPRYFTGKPILFLTLMARLGYDKSYLFGSDPIEPRKLRQPNPLTGQVGNGTALRSERGVGTLSIARKVRDGTGRGSQTGRYDDKGSRVVMDLTPSITRHTYLEMGTRT